MILTCFICVEQELKVRPHAPSIHRRHQHVVGGKRPQAAKGEAPVVADGPVGAVWALKFHDVLCDQAIGLHRGEPGQVNRAGGDGPVMLNHWGCSGHWGRPEGTKDRRLIDWSSQTQPSQNVILGSPTPLASYKLNNFTYSRAPVMCWPP